MNKNFMDLEFPKGPFDSLFDMAVAYDRACSECDFDTMITREGLLKDLHDRVKAAPLFTEDDGDTILGKCAILSTPIALDMAMSGIPPEMLYGKTSIPEKVKRTYNPDLETLVLQLQEIIAAVKTIRESMLEEIKTLSSPKEREDLQTKMKILDNATGRAISVILSGFFFAYGEIGTNKRIDNEAMCCLCSIITKQLSGVYIVDLNNLSAHDGHAPTKNQMLDAKSPDYCAYAAFLKPAFEALSEEERESRGDYDLFQFRLDHDDCEFARVRVREKEMNKSPNLDTMINNILGKVISSKPSAITMNESQTPS